EAGIKCAGNAINRKRVLHVIRLAKQVFDISVDYSAIVSEIDFTECLHRLRAEGLVLCSTFDLWLDFQNYYT
ncbi:hypothetical protein BgiBS90_005387, partial [Biomphalaria glabrata]